MVIVPVEPTIGAIMDPILRKTQIAHLHGPMIQALFELEAYVGHSLSLSNEEAALKFGDDVWPSAPVFEGSKFLRFRSQAARRSLSSVTLATHLERAGLKWEVVDPCIQELEYWRRRLAQARKDPPKAIAICSTFIVGEFWIKTLLGYAREMLPNTKILLGGYFYAVNVKKFLALDADVFCVGEGEIRLPEIVRAVNSGGSLDHIPGLYVRKPDGSLLYTGRVEPLSMEDLPLPDWRLASRIEPPIDLDNCQVSTWVETQRGCVFKCEFCDYRTIALPNVMSPERAVEAILSAAVASKGSLRLTDATASFPHKRWEDMMRLLIERGGSPVPIWCYSRVSDLYDHAVDLMSRAGVKHVFVGQESGDQRIILAMKKGTSVKHVQPAVAALAKHGVGATFAFIHGFPGEDDASINATRSMIVHINDGFEKEPPVLQYLVQPLGVIDFAQVSRSKEMEGTEHWMGYDGAGITPERAMKEVYETVIAASRVPHAPAFMLTPGTMPVYWEEFFFFTPHRYKIHRWYKLIERGCAIFMERAVEGTPVNDAELARIKRQILSYYDELPVWRTAARRVMAGAAGAVFKRLVSECAHEKDRGPGPLTRALVGVSALKDTGKPKLALKALQTGSYPDPRELDGGGEAAALEPTNLRAMVDNVFEESFGEDQRKRQIEFAKKLVSTERLSKTNKPEPAPAS
jgi:radical SAM superfamily enzyme YgiQ (UPF0313 family)